jgi:hypothetical protein
MSPFLQKKKKPYYFFFLKSELQCIVHNQDLLWCLVKPWDQSLVSPKKKRLAVNGTPRIIQYTNAQWFAAAQQVELCARSEYCNREFNNRNYCPLVLVLPCSVHNPFALFLGFSTVTFYFICRTWTVKQNSISVYMYKTNRNQCWPWNRLNLNLSDFKSFGKFLLWWTFVLLDQRVGIVFLHWKMEWGAVVCNDALLVYFGWLDILVSW